MITHNINKINNIYNTMYQSSVVHSSSKPHIFKGDSGATNHYVTPAASSLLKNVKTNTSINVTLPDSTTISSTHSGNIQIPKLSNVATTAHILPELMHSKKNVPYFDLIIIIRILFRTFCCK